MHVFPDGRTVQIPTDGKPLAGYALALADVTKHGAMPSENSLAAARTAGINIDTVLASNAPLPANSGANPFAKLLGLAKDGEEEEADAEATPVAWHPNAVALAGLDPKTEKKPAVASAVKAKVAARDRKAETCPRRDTAAYRCSRPPHRRGPPPRRSSRFLPPRRRTRSSSPAATGKDRLTE